MTGKIDVIFSGYLTERVGMKEIEGLEISSGMTVKEVLDQWELSQRLVGFVQVNGKNVHFNYVLSDGDKMKVFPLIIGG